MRTTPARVTGVTAADQAAALADWTPERMRQVGDGSEDKRESVARHWPAAAPKGVGRLFVTDVPGQDSGRQLDPSAAATRSSCK